MQVRLSQLADLTGGVISGDKDSLIEKAAPLHATDERAEELASIVDIERVDELKARCVYGAGCLDFTKAAGQSK